MSHRRFVCGGCKLELPAPGVRGPLPAFCETCRPGCSPLPRARALNRELAERIFVLEQQLRAENPRLTSRAQRHGQPGRAALSLAIRAVAQAEGAAATADALRDLAAVAMAWASALKRETDSNLRPA